MSADQDRCEWVCFFWYRLIQVVPDRMPLYGCVRVCVSVTHTYHTHTHTRTHAHSEPNAPP